MNIEKIKEITLEILKRFDLELYSIRTKREYGMNILEILVDGDDIDASSLGAVNESINEAIDEYLLNNYYLEVSTAGAIRVLNSLDQVKRQVGKYLRVTKDNKSIKGVLEKVEDDTLFIKINDKGRIKVIETSFSEADEVELTVKF
ncbi:MAG TPA: hypothetical protein GXX71_02205 [Acholeplasma sp.]|nr:hypothetical protein [Acholeplasmatales bacterium]HHV33487.1 hypothetical protein [Acholeplasma sp.]